MNDYPIQQHILDIRETSAKASESKESALKFLYDAGIIAKPHVKEQAKTAIKK